ncbi:uncharacterized protein LOC121733317 [Aricia agestis]|uniref:uncharacterized protein LOC121733317 n=1 Tax=Aricia agestis TaxID=91739 RepID=UPI001C208C11|nr:uncharacterized protein LOC121733317 [Aricia agestis]
MLTFRPKLGSEQGKEWRCCFCLHVRTGCILLGSWHLILHLVALGFLAAIVRDPNLLDELERDSIKDWRPMYGDAMPTPLSNVEARPTAHQQYGQLPRDHSLIYHDVDMGALVTVCTLAITLMLIYGAARGKPAHLLPFFCLQIFDFAITVLTAMGYMCYLRSMHSLVREAPRVPWRDQLLALPPPALAFVVLCAFVLAVVVKLYWIGVVWRCYKYLTMRTHALAQLTPFVITPAPAPLAPSAAPPAPYTSLLPDYEEAVKQTPPPSYRAAVAQVQLLCRYGRRPRARPAPRTTLVTRDEMASTMQLEFTQAMTDFKTMFPDMDDDVIEAVLRANQGAVDATIDQLLAMSTDNQNERLRLEMERVEASSPRRPRAASRAPSADDTAALVDVEDESVPLAVRRKWVPRMLGPLPPMFLRIPPGTDARIDLSLDMDDERIVAFLQNEEFMAELRWNQEFIAALDSEQGHKTKCHDDDAAFKERLKNMGKLSRKKFAQLSRMFSRGGLKRSGNARTPARGPPDSLLLQEEHSDDEDRQPHHIKI